MRRSSPALVPLVVGLAMVAVALGALLRSVVPMAFDLRWLVPVALVVMGALGVARSWQRTRNAKASEHEDLR